MKYHGKGKQCTPLSVMEPDSEEAGCSDEYEKSEAKWYAEAGVTEPSWARELAWMESPTGNLSEEMISSTDEDSKGTSDNEHEEGSRGGASRRRNDEHAQADDRGEVAQGCECDDVRKIEKPNLF